MPGYNNRFESAKFVEERILDQKGNVVGLIRLKPSGVLWKPKSAGKFYAVPLATFTQWITDPATNATRTKS
jgi:hypothetical protein